MSVTPLAAGRHSIRGSRPTTQNVEEGFRLEGPGQADASSPQGSAALLLFALSNLAAAPLEVGLEASTTTEPL